VFSGALTRAPGEQVGAYRISLGSLNAGSNYEIIAEHSDFVISPAPLRVTADAGQGKIYGDADPVFTYTVFGLIEEEAASSVLTGSLARAIGEGVGTYQIHQGTLTANENYALEFEGVDFVISPAPLLVRVHSGQVKTYGTSDPVRYLYDVVGLRGDDTDDDVLEGSLTREAGEQVGSYRIRQGTLVLTNDNYQLSFEGEDFFIQPLQITVLAKSMGRRIRSYHTRLWVSVTRRLQAPYLDPSYASLVKRWECIGSIRER
jgi:hypothetical protein